MKYLLGSSYCAKNDWQMEFAPIWISNVERFANPQPTRIVVVSMMGHSLPFTRYNVDELLLPGNLGHFTEVLDGRKPYKFNGWTGSMIVGACAAYCDESDFIFMEQDCLAFGPWVEKLYEAMGDGNVAFGRKHQTEPWMPCSQSLFIVRHSYIPDFVSMIYSSPAQTRDCELGEHKFIRFKEEHPGWRQFEWGYDRERPFSIDPVFYIQQVTKEEVEFLRSKGLL